MRTAGKPRGKEEEVGANVVNEVDELDSTEGRLV